MNGCILRLYIIPMSILVMFTFWIVLFLTTSQVTISAVQDKINSAPKTAIVTDNHLQDFIP